MRNDAYTRSTEPRLATDRIPGTVENHTGGAVFELDPLAIARRFLMIGTTGGTYYQGEREITRENADVIFHLAQHDPEGLVSLIQDVSVRGLAPKLAPQLFALAVCTHQPGPARELAFKAFPVIIRTGGHLLQWAGYHKALGGKVGRSWRRTVATWYTERSPENLAYQLAKYGQREGWSQKDLIDMSHALSGEIPESTAKVLRWARGESVMVDSTFPRVLTVLDALKRESKAYSAFEAADAGLSWEMVPDKMKRDPEFWTALLNGDHLPLGAMLRQLPRLTELKVIDDWFANNPSERIRAKFGDENQLRKARLHPLSILLAIRSYGQGATRGGLAYKPNMRLVEVLDRAFYKAFETAPASGKRHLVGVDVSSSMTMRTAIGLSSNEIAAALAMKIMASEPASMVVGFAHEIRELPLNSVTSLENACKITQDRSFGSTNPSALIQFAAHRRLPVDTFVVITDNEVNRGQHVPDALRAYRNIMGLDSKLVVLATTATRFSIADPKDPGMLDIAGFGADVPALLTQFSAGL